MAAEIPPPPYAAVSTALPTPDLSEESDSGDIGGSFVIVDGGDAADLAAAVADSDEIAADLEEKDEISVLDEKIEKENYEEFLEGNVESEKVGKKIILTEDDTAVDDVQSYERSENGGLHVDDEKKEIEENGDDSEENELHVEDEKRVNEENGEKLQENELHVKDEKKGIVENGEESEEKELLDEDEKKEIEENGDNLEGGDTEKNYTEKNGEKPENVLHGDYEKKEGNGKGKKLEENVLHVEDEKKGIEENGGRLEKQELHGQDKKKDSIENNKEVEQNVLNFEDEKKTEENEDKLEEPEFHGQDEKSDLEEKGKESLENELHVGDKEDYEQNGEALEKGELYVEGIDTEDQKDELFDNGKNNELTSLNSVEVENVENGFELEEEEDDRTDVQKEEACELENAKDGALELKHEQDEPTVKEEKVNSEDVIDEKKIVEIEEVAINQADPEIITEADEEEQESSASITTLVEQTVVPEVVIGQVDPVTITEADEDEKESTANVTTAPDQDQTVVPEVVIDHADSETITEADEEEKESSANVATAAEETVVPEVVLDKADPETITEADEEEKESGNVTAAAEQMDVPSIEIIDREINGESKSESNRQAGDEDFISNADNLHVETEAGTDMQIDDEAKGSELVDEEKVEPVKIEDGNEKVEEAEVTEVVQDSDEKGKPIYLIMVPRFTNKEKLEEKAIVQAELLEKTKARDYINASIKEQKVVISECQQKWEAAKAEENIIRSKINDKRKEIGNVQMVIDIMKNANSIDDIDDKILNMERMIQHETMPLKQEKQYLNDIKRLKHQREELSSNMGPEKDIQEAFEQKDEIGERLKLLRKEFDSLKNELSRSESATRAAGKKMYDERQVLKDLHSQLQAASSHREEVYAQLKKLNSELNTLNKQFYAFKDSRTAAENLRASKDIEGLRSYCRNQVERIMEMWNNDEEFRKQYVKFNEARTVRRLGTPDGRVLGPNEKPVVLQTSVDQFSSKPVLSSLNTEKPADTGSSAKSMLNGKKIELNGKKIEPEGGIVSNRETNSEKSTKTSKDRLVEPASEIMQAIQESKSKKSSKPASKKNLQTIIPVEDKVEEVVPKTFTKEEEELARKEEELRKEKAAAELKERLRLEQKEKAKEAEERKKRMAEKAQAKAEYRKHKEAEEKEKRRAKKDKKKAGSAEMDLVADALTTEPSPPVTIQESESTVTTVKKRTSRPVPAKYSKAQPVPLPLRNRSKRKIQTWMWAVLLCTLVAVLFFAGNYISLSNLIPPSFGF